MQVPVHWIRGCVPSQLRTALLLAALVSFTVTTDPVRAQIEPISDLPFLDDPGGAAGNGNGRTFTCTWHESCAPPNDPDVPDDNGRGIDIRARPEGRFPIYAAGHGNVSESRSRRGTTWGQVVKVDHGTDESLYAHLFSRSVAINQRSCRFVMLGYAGNSGGVPPHIHFGTEFPDARFGDIFGIRPDDGLDEDYFEVRTEPDGSDKVLHHQCDGPCSKHTNAYTVDDVQTAEFFRSAGWIRRGAGGFDYFDRTDGSYRRAHIPDDGSSSQVTWRPHLPAIDSDWKIFAYIPEDDPHSNVAPVVRYQTEFFFDSSSTSPTTLTSFRNQEDSRDEWISINGSGVPTHWAFGEPGKPAPLTVRLDNGAHQGCATGGCQGTSVLADAMLFVPSSCG